MALVFCFSGLVIQEARAGYTGPVSSNKARYAEKRIYKIDKSKTSPAINRVPSPIYKVRPRTTKQEDSKFKAKKSSTTFPKDYRREVVTPIVDGEETPDEPVVPDEPDEPENPPINCGAGMQINANGDQCESICPDEIYSYNLGKCIPLPTTVTENIGTYTINIGADVDPADPYRDQKRIQEAFDLATKKELKTKDENTNVLKVTHFDMVEIFIAPGRTLSFSDDMRDGFSIANAINGILSITGEGPGVILEREDGSQKAFRFAKLSSGFELNLKKLTFKNWGGKMAGRGGAIHNLGGTLIVDQCSFIGNSLIGAEDDINHECGGGAIASQQITVITNSLFKDNIVKSFGFEATGGAVWHETQDIYVEGSIFIGNKAEGMAFTDDVLMIGGAAIAQARKTGSHWYVYNTFINNNSHHAGGAIFARGPSDNTGILYPNDGELFMEGNILAYNVGGNCISNSDFQYITSKGYNISDDASCGNVLTAEGDQNSFVGLVFEDLGDHGGFILTAPLSAGSSLADYIPNCLTNYEGNLITKDAHLAERSVDCTPGAVEQ